MLGKILLAIVAIVIAVIIWAPKELTWLLPSVWSFLTLLFWIILGITIVVLVIIGLVLLVLMKADM